MGSTGGGAGREAQALRTIQPVLSPSVFADPYQVLSA